MKTLPFFFITAFTLIVGVCEPKSPSVPVRDDIPKSRSVLVGADIPKSPSVAEARHLYEEALQAAREKSVATRQAAKDESLKMLKTSLDTALNSKDLKESNLIVTTMKWITALDTALASKDFEEANTIAVAQDFRTKNWPPVNTTSSAVEIAMQSYAASIESAQDEYQEQVAPARTRYLGALEAALDAAFEGKDLEEANRIDAAIQPLRAEEAEAAAKLPPIGNSIGMSFKFLANGPDGAFSIGVHEVTQSQYEKVMGHNPSYFKGPDKPVEQVIWDDAVEFCVKLSALPAERAAGRNYRLPTEAEWEYACRAETTEFRFFGDAKDLTAFAWFADNSGDETHSVGEKLPNGWGLYDMQGNVFEWCDGNVYRGGSWCDDADDCSVRRRVRPARTFHPHYGGFRVAVGMKPKADSHRLEHETFEIQIKKIHRSVQDLISETEAFQNQTLRPLEGEYPEIREKLLRTRELTEDLKSDLAILDQLSKGNLDLPDRRDAEVLFQRINLKTELLTVAGKQLREMVERQTKIDAILEEGLAEGKERIRLMTEILKNDREKPPGWELQNRILERELARRPDLITSQKELLKKLDAVESQYLKTRE